MTTHHSGAARYTAWPDVELLTADWVGWFNNARLMHRLGRKPPVEFQADYYADLTQQPAGVG